MQISTRHIGPFVLWSLISTVLALPAAALAQDSSRSSESEETEPSGYVLYVESQTGFMNSALLEERLQERPEFRKLGLVITRNRAEADLVIEVYRSSLTTKFNYSILAPRKGLVVGSGRVNSLFGTASGKIAKAVVKTLTRRPRRVLVAEEP